MTNHILVFLTLATLVTLFGIMIYYLASADQRYRDSCEARGGVVVSELVPIMMGQPPRVQMMPRSKCKLAGDQPEE